MRAAILIVALSVLVGCGGDAGSGPLGSDDARELCERGCQHDADCGDTDPVQQCIDECVMEVTVGWIRGDAFEGFVDCYTGLACGASDDACWETCRPTSVHERYEAQCREVFAPCFADNPSQLESTCETTPRETVDGNDIGFICVVIPGIVDELIDCIPDGTECVAGLQCMGAVYERHGLIGQ